MIRVILSGLYSSIQDQGRRGYRKFGVPISGAMDQYALVRGNLILGNEPDCAVIEITGPGFECEFLNDVDICITGADFGAVGITGDSVLKPGKVVIAKTGDVLKFNEPGYGLRAYLHVKGGIAGVEKMGSRSMFRGERLKNGDILHIGDGVLGEGKSYYTNSYIEESCEYIIRVRTGPDAGLFPGKYLNSLLNSSYTISPNHDRMGIRLITDDDIKPVKKSIITKPVFPGCIQLPGDGNPIIIMNDGQTTGGYPVWAVVEKDDLRIAGQLKSSDKVYFLHV